MWKWTTRKISYVSIMIAVAVVFVLIGFMLFAITIIPSIKISFAGLPIKLVGYIFGPLVGAITGFLADIISFLFLPTFYHPGYSLSMAIAGMIPGIVMWIMIRKPRNINTHFFSTLIVLIVIWSLLFSFFHFLPIRIIDEATKGIITSRWIYEIIGVGGITGNIVILCILRFALKPKNFIAIAPIIMFTSILGVVNAFTLPYWDLLTLFNHVPYMTNLIGHYLLTLPIKLWFNIIVVYIAWKIIFPIIGKGKKNYWK